MRLTLECVAGVVARTRYTQCNRQIKLGRSTQSILEAIARLWFFRGRNRQRGCRGEICNCFCSRAPAWAFGISRCGNNACEGIISNEKRGEGSLLCVVVIESFGETAEESRWECKEARVSVTRA